MASALAWSTTIFCLSSSVLAAANAFCNDTRTPWFAEGSVPRVEIEVLRELIVRKFSFFFKLATLNNVNASSTFWAISAFFLNSAANTFVFLLIFFNLFNFALLIGVLDKSKSIWAFWISVDSRDSKMLMLSALSLMNKIFPFLNIRFNTFLPSSVLSNSFAIISLIPESFFLPKFTSNIL